ncbi:calcium-binding and coiled-coil domain-containing protein 2 [Brienomyrus brachyistius]|uniref:calcium-binding and coiled-coil domain-containing protein 2 n=1 Tax=Brienomyrus brachyistius TaxID=42636 RepID=UPI0020B1933D|nr:calcium-binding and coiled-coil domain-containing protein 2 [Brienomyrus brachyistius]
MSECSEAPPTSLVMDRSTAYSQIIFNEVPKSYPPNVPLKCIYMVTAAIQPDRRDWVGIFKVGWNTTRDYYTFVWANSSSDPQKENQEKPHVLFDAYYLPKEDGEFYQFCYVDSAGQVRGASTPFCFKNPEDLNLQYSLENDLLVISTQGQLENEKQDFYEDMEAQKLTIEELKANLDEKLLEISLLRKSNAELSEEVSRLQQQQTDREKEQKVEQTLLKDDKTLEVKKETETLVTQEDHLRMKDMEKENKELQQTLSTMKEKQEKAKPKINHLKNEREELKKKVKAQETEIAQLNSQARELERERQQCNEKQVRLQDQIQLLQVDLQSSQKDSVKLSGELRELRAQGKKITELQSENQLLHSSLLEREQEKTRLQESNTQQLQEIQRFEEACSRAQRFQQELEDVKKQMGRQAVSLAEKEQFIRKLENQLMETRRGVQEQVCMAGIAKSEKEELSHENQKLRGDIQTLQRQLSDIETRSVGSISLQNSNPYSPSRLCPSPVGSMGSSLVYGNPFQSDGTTTDEERMCRYCKEKFPGINMIELELHQQSHRMCPFCSLICDSMEQDEFENHVYSHEE